MSFDPYEFDRDYGTSRRVITEGEYTAHTFLWMVLGLLITFGVAIVCWVTKWRLERHVRFSSPFRSCLALLSLSICLSLKWAA